MSSISDLFINMKRNVKQGKFEAMVETVEGGGHKKKGGDFAAPLQLLEDKQNLGGGDCNIPK